MRPIVHDEPPTHAPPPRRPVGSRDACWAAGDLNLSARLPVIAWSARRRRPVQGKVDEYEEALKKAGMTPALAKQVLKRWAGPRTAAHTRQAACC